MTVPVKNMHSKGAHVAHKENNYRVIVATFESCFMLVQDHQVVAVFSPSFLKTSLKISTNS